MKRFLIWISLFISCYWPVILLNWVRVGGLRQFFNGWPYNNPPHMAIIMFGFIAACSIPFILSSIFIIHWTTRVLD